MDNKNENSTNDVVELNGYVDKRTIVTNPVFQDGYAVGWKFPVPEAFREALDIKITPTIRDGLYTQGKNYAFRAGDTIYNTPKAYKIWKEALKEFTFCVSIESAASARKVVTKKYETEEQVKYKEDEKESQPKKKFSFKRSNTNYGYVKFILSKPDKTKEQLEEIGKYETDQEKFVYFLQTGILITTNNEILRF